MPSPQPGSLWPRAWPAKSLLLAVSTATILCLSCSTPLASRGSPSWGGPLTGGRSQFNQSCGPTCAAPVNPSTGELLAPAATRLGPVAEKVVTAVEAAQGLLTIQRLLTEAELADVQAVVELCVAQAHADVNEAYQKKDDGFPFKNGKFPNDAECDRIVRVSDGGEKVTLARELGLLKHAAAFACIQERLPKELRGNFSIEPRYKGDPARNGAVLTNNKLDSLKPDLVVHAMRNATNIQCVFEFKFPCYERHRLDPLLSFGVKDQLKSYKRLAESCQVVLITPTGAVPYGG